MAFPRLIKERPRVIDTKYICSLTIKCKPGAVWKKIVTEDTITIRAMGIGNININIIYFNTNEKKEKRQKRPVF